MSSAVSSSIRSAIGALAMLMPFASVQAQPDCAAGVLSSYSTPCRIGAVTFSNFEASVFAPAASMLTPITSFGYLGQTYLGFSLTMPLTATSDFPAFACTNYLALVSLCLEGEYFSERSISFAVSASADAPGIILGGALTGVEMSGWSSGDWTGTASVTTAYRFQTGTELVFQPPFGAPTLVPTYASGEASVLVASCNPNCPDASLSFSSQPRIGPLRLTGSASVRVSSGRIAFGDQPDGEASMTVSRADFLWRVSDHAAPPTSVPEPSTLVLLTAGLLALPFARRRRQAR